MRRRRETTVVIAILILILYFMWVDKAFDDACIRGRVAC